MLQKAARLAFATLVYISPPLYGRERQEGINISDPVKAPAKEDVQICTVLIISTKPLQLFPDPGLLLTCFNFFPKSRLCLLLGFSGLFCCFRGKKYITPPPTLTVYKGSNGVPLTLSQLHPWPLKWTVKCRLIGETWQVMVFQRRGLGGSYTLSKHVPSHPAMLWIQPPQKAACTVCCSGLQTLFRGPQVS